MYLLIDAQHRVYKSKVVSGYMRAQAKKGNLMVLDIMNPSSVFPDRKLRGLSIAGEWEAIQEWKAEYKIDEEPLVSVD